MKTKIGIEQRIKGEFQAVMANAISALKTEGFGVLTTIDIKSTLKEKLNMDHPQYYTRKAKEQIGFN